jgi:hypothetical protein
MAKTKTPELSPEAQAANAAGEARREKERQARQKNAEKQRRFRESMKDEGYKQVLLWTLSSPDVKERMTAAGFRQAVAWERPGNEQWEKSGEVKVKLSVGIRETSIDMADKSPAVRKALASAMSDFLYALKDYPDKNAIYRDFIELLKPLGNPKE